MSDLTLHRRALASAAAFAVPLLIPSTLSAQEVADRLEEVVVTARKRNEDMQQVPVSVAAYPAVELMARSIAALSDLGQQAPNFLYGQQIQSGASAGQLYIRGVGQHDLNSTFNPSVGLYVDGVYVSRATSNDLDLTDAGQVEILYGPQGTLFGKNTNGGAVNIVSVRPDVAANAPSGTAQLETGSFDRFIAKFSVNLPLATDRAALLLSASRRIDSGYGTRSDGEREANQNRTGVAAQLLIVPADGWEATLRLDDTRIDERSGVYKLVEVRTSSAIPVDYAANTPYRYDDRWLTESPYATQGTGPNKNAGTVWGASATIRWIHPWGEVKSISGYRRLENDNDFDPDASPLTVLDIFAHVSQHQLSQELQATGRAFGDRIDWVAGLYTLHETIQDDQPANVGLEFFRGAANFDPQLQVINENYAAYGQANLHLTDGLTLTLGGRVGRDLVQVGRVQLDYPIPTVEQAYVRKSAGWTSVLPRASLDYRWTPHLMTYVSAAEGSKSGGFNGRAGSIAEFNGFAPEKVWTYEAGVKSDWLDQRLRVNATGFYSAYDDFQILLNSSVTDPTTGNPVPFSFVGNIPRASIRGGELAITTVPLRGVELSAGLGITDGRYERILPGSPVTTASSFVDAPKVTATASGSYSHPLSSGTSASFRLDYIHKTRIQYDYGNSPLVSQAPYGLLNSRLTVSALDGRITVFVSGTNLANAHYAIGGLDDGVGGSLGEVVKLMGAPREWGLGFKYRY